MENLRAYLELNGKLLNINLFEINVEEDETELIKDAIFCEQKFNNTIFGFAYAHYYKE